MIIGSKIILREKRLADALNDYTWETDPELAQLDAAPIVTTIFCQYLLDYASELNNPLPIRCQFALDTLEGKHIGNCSYYNINETKSEAELGIMIGNRDYWNKGYGTAAVSTLVNHVFQTTNLNRIYLKTLNSNVRAQKCFEKHGFTPYEQADKDGFSFVFMEIHRNQWRERKALQTTFAK
ncbi:GNAT family N-acetyltransferase [Chloroflexota bacterium]